VIMWSFPFALCSRHCGYYLIQLLYYCGALVIFIVDSDGKCIAIFSSVRLGRPN